MDDELLVRVYNVGFGDCIYVQVPDQGEKRHILIDCGTKGKAEEVLKGPLTGAQGVESMLPVDASGGRRLDLLVVTHPHRDHIAGFGDKLCLDWFKKITIGAIWLSAEMDPGHPQAQAARELHAFAANTLRELSRVSLTPAMDTLVGELLAAGDDAAMDALRVTLPDKLPGKKPLYVHSDTPAEQLRIFNEGTTRLRVLNPAQDIDGEYVSGVDAARQGFESFTSRLRSGAAPSFAENWGAAPNQPANISPADFRQLRSRLMNNALAFVMKEGDLPNNTSVVLLLEWRGRRLLFTGDVEFTKAYAKDAANGGWNVMWQHRKEYLSQALDFLKVGHHGSRNATPWVPKGGAVNEIFDALVRDKGPKKATIVVSTRRKEHETDPDPALMQELGRRAANPREYREYEHCQGSVPAEKLEEWRKKGLLLAPNVPQPARTDLEYQAIGDEPGRAYVEVRLPPAPGWQ